MATYKLSQDGIIKDGISFVPNDPGNRDFQEYQEWVDEGNTAEPLETVSEMQQRLKQVINTKRDEQLNQGLTFNGNVYDSDPVSRYNVASTIAAIGAGLDLPVGFTWRTKDNQNIAMDIPTMKLLGQAMLGAVNTTYGWSWTQKASVDAATTIPQLEAIENNL